MSKLPPSELPVNTGPPSGPPPGGLPTRERPLSGPPRGGLPRDWLPALVAFLDREPAVVRIVVAEVRGSTPREPGAFMLVGRDGVQGSIGGGQLEWEATAGARELLLGAGPNARVNKVVLGPDVGQCCGGVVSVLLERFTRESLDLLRTASEAGARGCAVLSSTIRQGGVGHSVVRHAATGTGGAVIGAVASVTGAGGAVTRADRSVTGPNPGVAAGDLSADEASDRLLHEPRQGAHTIVTRKSAADIDDATDRLLREPRQSARPILTRNAAGEPTFLERLDDEFPAVWLYGAGHVGQALARILAELPLRLTWIDSRAELFPDTIGSGARIIHDPDTLSTVSEAPVGAYFIVMSHSHPLDYSLCHALLERNDFAWLGLIGSMSKAARFRSRLTRASLGADVIRKLVCPIGVDGIDSKWPAAIAVAVAAQLMQQISAPPHTHRAQAELMRGEAPRAGLPRAEAAHVALAGAELLRGEASTVAVTRAEASRAGADPACAPEGCATCGTTPSRRGTVTS